MRITSIKFRGVKKNSFLSYADVTFDDCFVVKFLKVIQRKTGDRFIAMPSMKKTDDSFVDIAHPINADFRKYLEEEVLKRYENNSKPAKVEAGSGG